MPSATLRVLWLLAGLGLAAPCLPAEEITVFAAASLTEALEEIASAYQATSGNHVSLNAGASNDLARQIRAGAPADVFFSADAAQMDVLQAAGLVNAGDRLELLSNLLVIVVPTQSLVRIAVPADLARLKRVALADPEAVPAGVYARQWLESAGLWQKLKDAVVPTLNVRAALAAVESGNVDAGIVYRTDAALSKRSRVAFAVPAGEGPKIVYVAAVLAASKRPGAREFVKRLRSPESARVFEKRGFVVLASQ